MRKFFTIASLFAVALSSCAHDEAGSEAEGKGNVVISLDVVTNIEETRAYVDCTTPALSDFSLRIEGITDNTYVADYSSVDLFNENNSLHAGSYKAIVTAGDINEEGYDKATFVGETEFVVAARKNVTVNITATIANTLVKVEVTDNFKTYFAGGYDLTLTTANNEFDVTAQSEPIFIAPESFTIGGTAIKQPNQSGAEGVEVTLPEYSPQGTIAPQTLYTVKLDVENAGQAQLVITLNDEVEQVEPIEQELNDNAQ